MNLDYNESEKQLIIGYSNRTIRVMTSTLVEDFEGRLSGRFVLKNIFHIPEQIHTLNSRRISNKDYELIASQPGGNLLRFNPNEENGRTMDEGQCRDFEVKENEYLARLLATDICGNVTTGWSEAIALDKFQEETVYATICHGKNIFIQIQF